jgi:hypothetical protein
MSALRTIKRIGLGAGILLIPGMALGASGVLDSSPMVSTIKSVLIQQQPTSHVVAGWSIQVGAYAAQDKAQARLEEVAATNPQLLQSVRLVTSTEGEGAQILYRARFAGLSEDAATKICALLNRQGEDCFVSMDRVTVPDAPSEAALQPVAAVASSSDAVMDLSASPGPVVSPAPSKSRKFAALASSRQVSNDELSGMRGGFFTAAGANFDFGASIQTLVNGQLALQTNLTWTPQGPAIQQLAGLGQSIQSQVQSQVQSSLASAGIKTGAPASGTANAAGSALAQQAASVAAQPATSIATQPTVAAAVQPAVSVPAMAAASVPSAASAIQPVAALATNAAGEALNSAANAVGATPAPAAVSAPAVGAAPHVINIPTVLSGVTIPGATGGSTQVLANLSNNQIQNIILNSASNQTISQNTNVTLTIYNLQQWQQQLVQSALSSQLVKDSMAAAGVGH